MKESELKSLGFECVKQYTHDNYNTNRYTKGVLQVEFTYENGDLKTVDLNVTEVIGKLVTLNDMKALTPILGA